MTSIPQFPQFDEINVVSDIHMGGTEDFQILCQGKRLGSLFTKLAKQPDTKRVALVLNGDIIDSLAEDINGYVAIKSPERVMARLYDAPAFAPIWQGLKTFIRSTNRYLIFITGNHDIELSLPVVEQSIRHYLTGNEPDATIRNGLNGAITFATHGTGYTCLVGDAKVFCTHGNETDAWNHVNYEQLAQLGNALNCGHYVDKKNWKPNAGTRMVIDIMNPVKKDYPFVDLLKPETNLTVPILMVLAPERVKKLKIEDVIGVGVSKLKGDLVAKGLLSAHTADLEAVTDHSAAAQVGISQLLGDNLAQEVSIAPHTTDQDALLLAAEEALERGEALDSDSDSDESPDTLGWFQYLVDRVRGVDKYEALRKALLDWTKGDTTFELTTKDDTYNTIVPRVSDNVDFIVTGHTHLERAIKIREDAERYYYNSGTWIRLLSFTPYCLKNPVEFKKICQEVLEAKSMKVIDRAKIPTSKQKKIPFVMNRSSMVRIAAEDDGVIGKLFHVEGGDMGKKVALKQVPGTEFKKKTRSVSQ